MLSIFTIKVKDLLFLHSLFFSMTLLSATTGSCHKAGREMQEPVFFDSLPSRFPLAKKIPEASGIADSKKNPGYLWVEEDSGNPPDLSLLSHSGVFLKKIHLKAATNTDWEDIALAKGPRAGIDYLYIADIGDNNATHAQRCFYRLEEPSYQSDTVSGYDKIRYRYADGPRDAEAFLVDDISLDIYIITKRDAASRIYKLAYPYSTTSENIAVMIGELPYNGVVSAAVSGNGKELIVKTYMGLYYYQRGNGETIPKALQTKFYRLPYTLEPQGEAVCFSTTGATGFFTLSEKGFFSGQQLFFYEKK